VKAHVKWSSSGRKCLARKGWSKNPKMIPRRYDVDYYGIDLGKEYIISVPQQVNQVINQCGDEVDEIDVSFYDQKVVTGGVRIIYLGRNISKSKKLVGYPNPVRIDRCWKEPVYDNSSDVYVGFCKKEVNGPDPNYVYHDQIKPYTINLDFYFLDEPPAKDK
ncbi:hypothetical protein, partial [Zooshikella harenae]